MRSEPDVLAFGEILYDVFDDGVYLGGAPLNFAWYVKQLGVSVGMVSAVGSDDYGTEALRTLDEAGIDHTLVTQLALPTGTVDVCLTNGQPQFTINTGVAWDCIDQRDERIPIPEMLYFGTLAQRSSTNRQCLSALLAQKPRERFFDINLRQAYYDRSIVLHGIGEATIIKLNEEELVVLEQMTGITGAEKISTTYAIGALVVTRGANGASLYLEGQRIDAISPTVEVEDAVGAGDAFSAVMAVARLRQVPLSQALPIACEVGAFVVTQHGAQATLPEHLCKAFCR
jgi:fructokinase